MIHTRYVFGAVLLTLGATWVASQRAEAEGQPVDLFPLAEDFQVNTYTTDRQQEPDVAFHDEGFVVVWNSVGSPGSDVDGFSVQARRYLESGETLGDQFQVNVTTSNNQGSPRVAAWQDGRFVVVWQSQLATDPPDQGVAGRLYAADGSAMGGEFAIASYTTGDEGDPAVIVTGEGFVVVWSSDGSYGDDSFESIQLQRFDSAGAMQGQQLQVNTLPDNIQAPPEIAGAPGSGFVVVWPTGYFAPDPFLYSIQGQRFDSTGSAAGAEFRVDDLNTYVFHPDVAMTVDGEFMVVWRSSETPGDDVSGLVGRVFDSSGDPLGAGFLVNQRTGALESDPAIAALSDGTFQVVWSADDPNQGTDRDIVARVFDSAGSALTGEQVVNSFTTDLQFRPRLATTDSAGAVVVAWGSRMSPGDDSDETSVLLRRFRNAVFVDGFESGDTTAWSATVN